MLRRIIASIALAVGLGVAGISVAGAASADPAPANVAPVSAVQAQSAPSFWW